MSLFSRENAREMAARSVAVRQERARRPAPAPLPAPASTGPDPFTAGLLVEVRAHVTRLAARLEEELDRPKIDGQQVNWIVSAPERVADLERVLAGRPLPGSQRLGSGRPAPIPRPIVEPLPDLLPDTYPVLDPPPTEPIG